MEVLRIIVAGIAIWACQIAVLGWELMLFVGIVHAEWLSNLPTIGYKLAFGLAGMLTFIYSTLTWEYNNKS